MDSNTLQVLIIAAAITIVTVSRHWANRDHEEDDL